MTSRAASSMVVGLAETNNNLSPRKMIAASRAASSMGGAKFHDSCHSAMNGMVSVLSLGVRTLPIHIINKNFYDM